MYLQSARLGHSNAMNNLGIYYETAVTKDMSKAKEWYAKAAAYGNENAQKALARLNAT